ncbi:MAG: TonB-dependent receptor [Cyclobacteriaceae bacterium]|nr:MAG: TonB-dependent receptor [Cyclobacteriaceae bacterium]
MVDLNNIPVTEVNVIDLSSGRHTHSNEQGFFVLGGLNYGDTLQLTHLTYQPQRIVYHNTDSMFTVVLYPKSISLEEVVVSPSLNSLSLITDLDLKTGPVNSSQDLLMQVPGLFIGQHAGGGKAEQIFLRGFDVDHGTDVNVSVDGMPVNMVSHAHGQGYTDLHFVIPELVDNLDFGKGPYYADQGNFNTAGYIDFRTKKRLTNSQIKLERGQYNSTRVLGMFSLMNHESKSAYLASEYILTDGPFESPQNFGRVNLTGRFTADLSDSENIDISGSYFNSTWDASGQIPVRAVEDGTISRFGAIDDTEGGNTSRTNILVNYHKFLDPQSDIKTTVFFSHYDFQLYSNFTFFLNDPVNGDQIEQVETRQLLGFRSEFNRSFAGRINGSWSTGISMRNDQSLGNGLFHTRNRSETLQQIQLGDIYETNLSVYTGATFNLGKWAINPLIRWDYFDFKYRDQLTADYTTQSQSKAVLSPKLNLSYSYSNSLQLYIKAGKGFHSNDTRVVVKQEGRSILPAAFGTDVGLFWKPIPRLFINIAYWYLYLEQEFIYVGDEGIVEPGGATRRQGIDSSIRYQLMDGLFWNFDANYAHARSIDAEKGQDYIPLAPGFTLLTGLRLIQNSGFYGGINLRYLVDRPANEDYSLVAQGYAVMDFNIGYQWKTFNLGLDIQNLLDTDWNEAQFGTESRLFNEQASVEEIHFTPGTPFFLKVVASFKF